MKTIQFVDARALAAMLDPLRLAILRELRQPMSTASLARALDVRRQRLGHHVRALEAAGLVVAVGERRVGNFTERVLQASAASYFVRPDLLGALDDHSEDPIDPFSTGQLLHSASRTLRDVGQMASDSDDGGKKIPTLSLDRAVTFASFPRQREFADELSAAIDRLVARYHSPDSGGRTFRVAVAVHPQDARR